MKDKRIAELSEKYKDGSYDVTIISLSKQIAELLYVFYNPHTKVIIQDDRVDVCEAIYGTPFNIEN